MKLFKITCLIFLTALFFSCSKKTNEVAVTSNPTTTMAESKESAQPRGERAERDRGERKRPSPEERQKRQDEMYAQLNLSEAQKIKVEEINTNYQTKMRTMRENNDGGREAMRASMMKMREEQNAELKNVMTAEQFDKYLKIQESQKGRRGGRGRRGGE